MNEVIVRARNHITKTMRSDDVGRHPVRPVQAKGSADGRFERARTRSAKTTQHDELVVERFVRASGSRDKPNAEASTAAEHRPTRLHPRIRFRSGRTRRRVRLRNVKTSARPVPRTKTDAFCALVDHSFGSNYVKGRAKERKK